MPTKYQPLVDYIAAQTADVVTLSFTAMEAIVGYPLPDSMQVKVCCGRTGLHDGVALAGARVAGPP